MDNPAIPAGDHKNPLSEADAGDRHDEGDLGSVRPPEDAHNFPPWQSGSDPNGSDPSGSDPDDIVLARHETCRHSARTGQTWHPAGRPRGRQHHDHRRRPRDPQGPRATHRFAHADGHHPPRQADRSALAEDQGIRAARRAGRHRVRRLGHLRGNCYEAAKTAGVLEAALLEQMRPELEAIKPMAGGVRSAYVKRLDGPNVKKGKNKRDLADQLIADIRKFKADHGCDRLVMVWCGSTEVYMTEAPAHESLEAFERGLEASDDAIPSSMIYAYAALREGCRTRTPRRISRADVPALLELAAQTKSPLARQGHEDRADADQDDHRAGAQGAPARRRGLVLDQHPRQPRRRSARRSRVVQDQGGEQEVGARLHPPAAPLSRAVQAISLTSCASTTIRRAATTRKAGTTSTWSAGSDIRCS